MRIMEENENKKISRKKFLRQAAAGGVGLGISSCILGDSAPGPERQSSFEKGQPIYKWRMVTTWPPDFPILGEAAAEYARLINKMSGGRIEIKV
jgi:TRAP-type mannitol/chloroaromatic compound transport system substrate-binding protein